MGVQSNPLLKKSAFSVVRDYAFVTAGILMYVIGWTIFLIPRQLVGGGATGLSTIIQYSTGIPAGYSYFVINVILIVMALFILGRSFGMKTVYAMLLASVGLNVFQSMPVMADLSKQLAENDLMSIIMGALMSGVGIGMAMSAGGSTGGTDIIALMVNKYRNVSPGKVILLCDVVVILSSVFIPSSALDVEGDGTSLLATRISTIVYGLILVALNGTVVDLFLSGMRQSVQLFVISSKYDQIADAIATELHRGVTVLSGQGWYTKQDVKVLMVMTRKTDLSMFLRYIKTIDPDAFISVASVAGVYGTGFDVYKTFKKVKKL